MTCRIFLSHFFGGAKFHGSLVFYCPRFCCRLLQLQAMFSLANKIYFICRQQILNKNQKYFKTGDRKSRWTVPLLIEKNRQTIKKAFLVETPLERRRISRAPWCPAAPTILAQPGSLSTAVAEYSQTQTVIQCRRCSSKILPLILCPELFCSEVQTARIELITLTTT